MKNYFLIVTLLSTLLTTQKTRAEINMKDASLRLTFTDIGEISRRYNSRSLHQGHFGFGWCSNLEKNLNIKSPKEISFKDCDQETPFVLTDENNLLKSRTFTDPVTRELLIYKNSSYTYYLQNGDIKIFNKTGQLTDIIFRDGKKLSLNYKNGRLFKLKNLEGETLQFYFNDFNQLIKIESKRHRAIYLYEKENLIQSVNALGQSHTYEYDSFNNIILIVYPDKSEESIVYNNDHDRVLKIQLKNGCLEYYDFSQKNNPLYQVSTLTRKCGNQTIHQYIYEFWFKYRPDGYKYLERYKINQNFQKLKPQTVDITYHPFDGSPLRILKNGKNLI